MRENSSHPAPAPLTINPVAIIHSPFKEKFGIPRQPGLIANVPAQIELLPPFNRPEAIRGLEEFSHLWLIFHFHGCPPHDGSLTVRPPRLGGNKRMGVFATRGTHRPNPLGLSVVALEGIDSSNGMTLQVRGADLLDQTPIFDLKPYLPYVDAVTDAIGGFAHQRPRPILTVAMKDEIRQEVLRLSGSQPGLLSLIEEVIGYDPRPPFQQDDHRRIYGVRLYDLDVRFTVQGTQAEVTELKSLP